MENRSKMVPDNSQIRRQGAQDFRAYYEFACARQDSVPLPAVKMSVHKGLLQFNGDKLKLSDWPPVLDSISINKHLHHISVSSTFQGAMGPGSSDVRYYKSGFRKRIPAVRSKDMTFKLCKAIKECLTVSSSLKTLQMNGLPLRERDLVVLTKGLAKSVSLENLSLANCPISDQGLEVICQSVKYSPVIRTVDFSGCNITWRGAEHMANVIKHQAVHRHSAAWAESLRYRQPHFEMMGGLRRVTLNCNALIGDHGAAALARELTEDLWVKAVDLQRCGLSNEGARRLLESLKSNSALCVVDVRCNPLVDKGLIKTIIEKVLMNGEADGRSVEQYPWIKPAAAEPQRNTGVRKTSVPRTVRGKASVLTAASKITIGGRGSGGVRTQKPSSNSCNIPWRAAARAERQRGLPPPVTVTNQSFQHAATVKVTVDSEEEEEEEDEEEVTEEVEQRLSSLNLQEKLTRRHFDRLQMELKACRLSLAEERRARLRSESRLLEYELENSRLRDANQSLSDALAATGSGSAPPAVRALEDEAVLESIETSFTKFHAFLDLLKDAGLGQLASMAGIERSDFQPLGKPQLSSTVGNHGHLEKRAVFPLESGAPPAVPAKAPTPRRSFLEDMLQDLPVAKTTGPAAEPGGGGEKELEQYSRPYMRSGPQRSTSGPKSFGETFQIQPGVDVGNHRSGAHRRSPSSYSSGSHSGLSLRSSVSDIMSDRAESVGSAGSVNSRTDRLGT